MHKHHFALTHFPFRDTIPDEDMYESADVVEIRGRLGHLIELRGSGLISGEPGSGKTSAARCFLRALNVNRHRLAYVQMTTGTVIDLYRLICGALGIEQPNHRARAAQSIQAEISRMVKHERKIPVLIIDEAHLMHRLALEELRLLTNFDMDAEARLCLLLIGHSELSSMMAYASYASISQRLIVHYRCRGLGRDEIAPYISNRLARAGAADIEIFAPEAIEALALASAGLPRCLNRLAHHAMNAATGESVRIVTAHHVELAREEIA